MVITRVLLGYPSEILYVDVKKVTGRLTSQGQEASDHSEEDKHLGSTEGEEGQYKADDQDDEATEEHGGRRPTPRCKERETVVSQRHFPRSVGLPSPAHSMRMESISMGTGMAGGPVWD